MKFCTAVNCMDGRAQDPVNDYMKKRFDAEYVDVITEPGPNRILAEGDRADLAESIFARIEISVSCHESVGIAVAGHHDCAGNPASMEAQAAHVREAIEVVRRRYPDVPVIGLWVDETWAVSEIPED